jgi:hypothetical protein
MTCGMQARVIAAVDECLDVALKALAVVHGMDADASSQSPAHNRLAPWVQSCPRTIASSIERATKLHP